MKELFKHVEESATATLKDITNKQDIDVNQMLSKTVATMVKNIVPSTQPIENTKIFDNNIFTEQERKNRNSQFLYSLLIDSLALSIANGVIIMFEAQNLFYGFILLFIGVILSALGFTSMYADRPGLATFIVVIITFAVFPAEVLYLLTSQIRWFFIFPELFTIFTIIIVTVVGIHLFFKKRRQKKQPKSEDTGKIQ